MATQVSAVKWYDCTDFDDRPHFNELVLTINTSGRYGIMFFDHDTCAWNDPDYGWTTDIVAWARLPLYVPTVEKMVQRSNVDNADVWRAMALNLYDEICKEAEAIMAQTNTVSGAHYNAMKRVLQRHGVTAK